MQFLILAPAFGSITSRRRYGQDIMRLSPRTCSFASSFMQFIIASSLMRFLILLPAFRIIIFHSRDGIGTMRSSTHTYPLASSFMQCLILVSAFTLITFHSRDGQSIMRSSPRRLLLLSLFVVASSFIPCVILAPGFGSIASRRRYVLADQQQTPATLQFSKNNSDPLKPGAHWLVPVLSPGSSMGVSRYWQASSAVPLKESFLEVVG